MKQEHINLVNSFKELDNDDKKNEINKERRGKIFANIQHSSYLCHNETENKQKSSWKTISYRLENIVR